MGKGSSASEWYSDAPEAWLAAIVDSSDDAIVGKTLDSVIRSWNRGATRIFGYEPQEIVGRSVLTLIPPDRHFEETQIVSRLVRGERVDHFETIRRRKDGSYIDVSVSVSPIRSPSGDIVGAAKIARDISEMKQLRRAEYQLTEQLQELASELEQQLDEAQSLQQTLEETNERLAQAADAATTARRLAEDANAAKSIFLATMSHELRTPLNAIIGYVDLMDLGIGGTIAASHGEYLRRIRRGADTLLRLIDDVLTFAKLEGGRTEYRFSAVRVIDVADALEEFIAPRIALKGLAYQFVPCDPDLVVCVDRAKLEQILLNLLSNAVKFTNFGRVEVVCGSDKQHARIEVRDTGEGIRAELHEAIFEPFVQVGRSLTRTIEGTGLGLSISRQMARAMGGDITVESIVGQGSTFTVILPRDIQPCDS